MHVGRARAVLHVRYIHVCMCMHGACTMHDQRRSGYPARACDCRCGQSPLVVVQVHMVKPDDPGCSAPSRGWLYRKHNADGDLNCRYCNSLAKECRCFVDCQGSDSLGWSLPMGWYGAKLSQLHQFFREVFPRRSVRLQRRALLSAQPSIRK